MINLDDVIKEETKEHDPKLATNSWLSVHNINNQRLWISKNNFII